MAHDFGGPEGARIPVGQSEREQARIPHAKTSPYIYSYHPYRWMWVDGEWLPILTRKRLEPGVGRIDRTGDTTLMEVAAHRHGSILIPRDRVPPGTPGGTYLAAYRCRDGIHYCDVWETPQHAGGRPMGHAVDRDGYHDWLRWLVREGHVPPITEAVRQRLEGKRAKRRAKRDARLAERAAKADGPNVPQMAPADD